MNLHDIANFRLISQQVTATEFKTAGEIVRWMGAMQAQDYPMARWAIGIRLPGSTNLNIEDSLNRGEILRAHVLRGTWHFVVPEDILWMMNLTAPQMKSSLAFRHRQLELSGDMLMKSMTVVEKAFSRNDHLFRDELVGEFKKAGIPVDNNRASHLLFWAELEGLVCSGPIINNKQCYTILEHYKLKTPKLSKEEALAKLAGKYFHSHFPATLQDFSWWSGLNLTDARLGLELNKAGLISETVGSLTFWFPADFSSPDDNPGSVYLLPAYDEFIISYKTREAALAAGHQKKVISSNGIFRPVIVVNGQVSGLWKRTISNNKVIIEAEYYRSHNKKELNSLLQASVNFGHFLEKESEFKSN